MLNLLKKLKKRLSSKKKPTIEEARIHFLEENEKMDKDPEMQKDLENYLKESGQIKR